MRTRGHPSLIDADDLRVSFGSQVVLDGLSFELRQPRVVGIRGPNGAGKTTLLNVLVGLQPFSGTVRVLGRDPRERLSPRERPGVLLSENGLYEALSAKAQLLLHARMFGLPRAAADARVTVLAEELGMVDYLLRTPRTFSSGMRRRLALARCFLIDKPLYLLDEPDRGIDSEGRLWLEGKLERSRHEGVGVVLVSHDHVLLDTVCDEVYELEQGQLQPATRSGCWLRIFSHDPPALRRHLEACPDVEWLAAHPGRVDCGVRDREAALRLVGALPSELARRAEVRW